MKRILLSIFVLIAAQSMFAMEPEIHNLTQQSIDEDDGFSDLIFAIRQQDFSTAIALIEGGADVNKPAVGFLPIDAIHFIGDRMNSEKNRLRIEVVKKLIEHGLRMNTDVLSGCLYSYDLPILQLLLDANADIYSKCVRFWTEPVTALAFHASKPSARLDFVQMIAQKAISMTPGETNCIKGWLLACNRLKKNFKSIATDLRKPIADMIIGALAYDAYDRLARAGALDAYDRTPDDQTHFDIRQYLANMLDYEHVHAYVRNQVLQAIRTTPFTRELTEDEAFGRFNSNNQ